MTVQIADKLFNDHPRVQLGGFQLYGIVQGDIGENYGWGEKYAFETPPAPPDDAPVCSALWRRYVAGLRVHPDGRLELIGYDYMVSRGKWKQHAVGEWVSGDFWLVLKRHFNGPRTYVPFRDGVIVEDKSMWVFEPESETHRRFERMFSPTERDEV